MKSIIKFSVCLLFLTNSSVYAASAYIGGSIGSAVALDAESNISDTQAVLAGLGASSVVNYDKTSPAGSFVVGVEANPYLAAEFALTYLGSYKLSASGSNGILSVNGNETDKVSAISAAVIGKFPVYRKIKVIGKTGIADTSIRASCAISGAVCLTVTDSDVSAVIGAGVSLRPVHALEIRVDYTLYTNVGNKNNEYTAGNFGLIETSALYHF